MDDNVQSQYYRCTVKKISFLVLIFLFFGWQTTVFAVFPDLPETHPNLKAIEYLQSRNILRGYPDGTFRPENPINRVEFLKIAIKGSNVPLDITTKSGFPDINESEWYAPYVRKAKADGWIQGYSDGFFRPLQTINKVEALKILAEVQNWDILSKSQIKNAPFQDVAVLAWYTPYVIYAKEHNFLEETGKFFFPGEPMTRAKISEIVYRTLTSGSLSANEPEEIDTISQTNFIPVPYETIEENFFNNIELDDTFPNIFYKNEIYYLNGKILSGSYDSIFTFLSYEDDNGTNQNLNYTASVVNGTFSIPVIFRYTGNFQLGLIPGNAGTSKIVNISVLSDLPTAEGSEIAPEAQDLSINFLNGQTTVNWNNTENTLLLITFQQNERKKTFFLRQPSTLLKVQYKDFRNFEKGIVSFYIETAKTLSTKPLQFSSFWTKSETKTFSATTHTFSEINKKDLSLPKIPELLTTVQKISFSGTTKRDIFEDAIVTLPNGLTTKVKLTTSASRLDYFGYSIIPAGSSFSFSHTPASAGTHIIEINTKEGEALLNTPVYIGKQIPLIPDFFDLNEPFLSTTSLNLTEARTEMTNLINRDRKLLGLPSITLDSSLNTLAQKHTEDMIKNNFFGHVNLFGESPEDRRLNLGIPMPVGENIAQASSVEFSHEGLMRSGIHRQNIINTNWTKVGLGFKKDSQGNIFIVQEFSRPYTEEELATIKANVFKIINQERQNLGHTSLIRNSALENIAAKWSEIMANQGFSGFTAPQGQTLQDLLSQESINTPVQGFVLSTLLVNNTFENKIIQESTVTAGQWKNIGIGIKADSIGTLKLTLIYSSDRVATSGPTPDYDKRTLRSNTLISTIKNVPSEDFTK